jgi:hypothetical protein
VRRPSRRDALRLGAALPFVLALFGGCRRRDEPKPVRARFGVFFGGEVQEREEVPLVLDRARQSFGIRVEFTEPPASTVLVRWELEKPSAGKDAGAGLVDYGQARTRPGEPVLDIPLAFRTGDRAGNWRVRVLLGDETLLDRGFRVIPPAPATPPEE